jgi:hypothetical protein
MPAMTTDPLARECLRCYLTRMLNSRGCDGTKTWATRWRDHRMPRAEGLLGQLADRGGCCCDCEMIFNAWADPDESIDPATRATCHGTDDTDPLVPCTGWSLTPQTQVMPPGDYESDEYDEAYW